MTATNEQVFVNGKFFTARNEEEFVSAFKVTDGKFSWVGDTSEVDSAGAIDLQGKTVLAGFIDVHTHPTYVAMTLGAVACTPLSVNDISEMIEALKQHPNYGKGRTIGSRVGATTSPSSPSTVPPPTRISTRSPPPSLPTCCARTATPASATQGLWHWPGQPQTPPIPRMAGSAVTTTVSPTACSSSTVPTTWC